MPLDNTKLNTEIRSIIDQSYVGFEGFPETVDESATRWAEAIYQYALDILPITLGNDLAKALAQLQLSLISTELVNGLPQFILALQQYAGAVAEGMAPASKGLLKGTPPVSPPLLAPIFLAGFSGASSEHIANLLANEIHRWMKTGTATNINTGTTITWT